MTSTDEFDEFRRLIQISIDEHADKYSRIPQEFIKRLNLIVEEIVIESRKNVKEFGNDYNGRNEFLLGFKTKLEIVETTIFEERSGILYYFDLHA